MGSRLRPLAAGGVPGNRSVAVNSPASNADATALELIARHLAFEASRGLPAAGRHVVAARVHDVHEACLAADALALEDAVTSATAGLAAWLDQVRQAWLAVPVDELNAQRPAMRTGSACRPDANQNPSRANEQEDS